MSDLKLFQTHSGTMVELDSSASPLEKSLQTQFEKNLDTLLGVRFLASEYVTSHGGRMDTLGIDENGYTRMQPIRRRPATLAIHMRMSW